MVRPRTIDRERLLDIAELLILEAGTGAISFGRLADAAGLSKASVQSVFVTREAMVEALLERWLRHERLAYDEEVGTGATLKERVRRHIKMTKKESEETNSRLAAVLAAQVGESRPNTAMANWYGARVGDLSAGTQEERLQRIAFLAAEGAFFMRYIVGYPITDRLWRELFRDLTRFVKESPK
jgi:AcrR family transcriptional regulator